MKNLVRCAVLSMFFVSTAQAQTELKPEWEIGAGFAAIDFPDVPRLGRAQVLLLPVPYFVYRGETLQVNRERVRGLIFRARAAKWISA